MGDSGQTDPPGRHPPAGSKRRVLVLVRDLMFLSKIRETLRSLDLEPLTLGSALDLDSPGADRTALLIADVNDAGLDPMEAIARARTRGIPVLAFGSHVDMASLEGARKAGADEVVPRSVFSSRLPDLVLSLLRRGDPQ